jgi:ergosteryl-3beta-O-L-aspartate synthase
VLSEEENVISGHMVRWAERLPSETIVLVTGVLQKPVDVEKVVGATIHDVELLIRTLHVLSQPTKHLPFTVYEAQEETIKAKEAHDEDNRHNITDRTRLTHRLIDLRTPASQSIFRINAAVCNLFRTHLNDLGFIEIHTPKLQGGATESGASVFEVSYFNRAAFLAQSPQLAKQMCISADFNRVYEIGPVFRAENSNTHRHLTEYVGLDIEMALQESYYEAMDVIDDTLKAIFKGIYDRYRRELEIVKLRYPHEDLVWLEETPRIPFAEGIRMLVESGWKNEDGSEPSPDEDLSTRAEIRLGELVKEKYHTDYYILDKFPTDARPFYTMRDPENPKVTNSFDIFLRGQEITTGGQRQHDARKLKERMRELNISVHSMEEYIDGFEYGAPPHAGCGIGLERIIMLLLNLGNVRFASLFPRDPKSLPARPPVLELPHPEASTNPPPWRNLEVTADTDLNEREFQPLEKLIANYGDATNTSWLDDRYRIWRHRDTGAAIGYVPSSHRTAIVVGDPLCDPSQKPRVIDDFLGWLRTELKLKPIWLLISEEVEEFLAGNKGWHTLTCVAEQKIDKPSAVDAAYDKSVQKKLRHAQAEGIKVTEYPPFKLPPEDVMKKCDERVKDWQHNRKGEQVSGDLLISRCKFPDFVFPFRSISLISARGSIRSTVDTLRLRPRMARFTPCASCTSYPLYTATKSSSHSTSPAHLRARSSTLSPRRSRLLPPQAHAP